MLSHSLLIVQVLWSPSPTLNFINSYLLHCVFLNVCWSWLQIGVLEDTRNRTLHGILRVQSCFRGYQARCHRNELWRGITALQSCISFFSTLFFWPVIFLGTVTDWKLFFTHYAVIRGEKSRKGFATLLQRHRAAVTIQKHVKTEFARNRMKNTIDAAVVIQSCKNF